MHPDPKARPTATESLADLEIVVSSISAKRLRTRIWRTEDTLTQRLGRFIARFL